GVVDAMVQWWYGHNAVAFFLTAGFLGMMYYFVPRQAQQPLWSYRFSIVNFWALISIYMWAGPHHLLYSSLPDWVQSVGSVFSLVLLMPSLGSAANGLMTFNGSWDKVRTDPAVKFMVVALVFYAASTFEGSMLSIKSLNSLSHNTDWTVAHVHSGAIGWVAMITIGSLYAMAPRALGRPQMYSIRAMNVHFWMHAAGLLLYVASMWTAGIVEGLMWRATSPDGTLVYSFLESLIAVKPFYLLRLLGGLLIVAGMGVMAWNMWHTAEHARLRLIKAIPIQIPEPPPQYARATNKKPCDEASIPPWPSAREARRAPGNTDGVHGCGRPPRGDHAAIHEGDRDAARAGHRAVRPVAARRTRHLRARRLLRVSHADDPHAALRDAALRRLLGGRRVRLRPSVPVGIQANGPGSRAHRRQVQRRMAQAASARPARRRARIEHAGLSVARGRAGRREGRAGAHARAEAARRSVRRRRDRRCDRSAGGQDRARRARRVSPGTRHAGRASMTSLYGHIVGFLILLLMSVFLTIWFWAWRPRHKATFDALAAIPMQDNDPREAPDN